MLQEKPKGTFWPTQFREGVTELVSCRHVFQTRPVWAQSEGSQPLYYAVSTITAFSQLASEWSKAADSASHDWLCQQMHMSRQPQTRASQVVLVVKNLSTMQETQETQIQPLG